MKISNDADNLQQQSQRYIQLLRRNVWRTAFWTLMLTLASIVIIAKLPDQYKATTTILVDPQQIPDRYVASTITADPAERLNTLTQQVLSETRLSAIIAEMDLYPELRHGPHEQVVEEMRKHLTVQVKQSSSQGLSSFTIAYQGDSPVLVAAVANRLAQSFIEWNLKTREERAEQTTQFLSAQLEEAKKALQEQEEKLRVFKMQHLGEMPDQLPANLQALSRLQAAQQANADHLNRLDQEKQLLIRLPEAAQEGAPAELSPRARLELEQRQLTNNVWDLKKKYTSSHPDVIAAEKRLQEVEAQLKALPRAALDPPKENSSTSVRLDLLEHERQRVLQDQQRIQAQTEKYQDKVDAVPRREQQLSELTRDYEISKDHYRSLLEKTLSAEMATELEHKQEGERFTIMDPARRPDHPFRPNRLALMSASLAGSFCLVAGILVFRDSISASLNNEKELKEILPASVVILGSIPQITTTADEKHRLRLGLAGVIFSLAACALVAIFLWKVQPIL